MAKKPTITTVSSGFLSRDQINTNFTNIRDAFDNTLSLDGSTPNTLTANIDMDGYNIVNLGALSAVGGGAIDLTDFNTVAAITSDITTVAGISANVATVVGISADVTAVAGDAIDIGTVSSNIANVNTVAGISANITTVAGDTVAINGVYNNLTDVTNFFDVYRVSASEPVTGNDEGDLYWNSTTNSLNVYNGASWESVSASGLSSLVEDTTPQLGGNLDLNGNDITGTGNVSITGDVSLGGTSITAGAVPTWTPHCLGQGSGRSGSAGAFKGMFFEVTANCTIYGFQTAEYDNPITKGFALKMSGSNPASATILSVDASSGDVAVPTWASSTVVAGRTYMFTTPATYTAGDYLVLCSAVTTGTGTTPHRGCFPSLTTTFGPADSQYLKHIGSAKFDDGIASDVTTGWTCDGAAGGVFAGINVLIGA